jgi:general nucleoside transport system ATP-binding protein
MHPNGVNDDSARIERMEMIDIVKHFPGVRANDGVSLAVSSGEVHAILGENGAGKSTLMRQLYGMYQPDGGEIRINGDVATFHSPADAIAAGIGMIHQHFMLVPTMTVAQNVALGRPSTRGLRLDLDVVRARVATLAEAYGLDVDPDARIWQLSVGEQQRVEILKALDLGASLIILDEPTAVLTPQEVDELFRTLRHMVSEGHSLLFISHKLHEVLDVSDRITVLRDGITIGTRATAEVSRPELVRMMVGRDLKPIARTGRADADAGAPALTIDRISVRGDRGELSVRELSLSVHKGEIVGLAGVSGNGQRELAEALVGVRPVEGGRVELCGRDITGVPLGERVGAGMAFVPEERMRDGAIGTFSVQENVFLRDHAVAPFRRGPFLNFREMARHARKLVSAYRVKTPTIDTPLKNLSGGNIQKLIIARELARRPEFFLAAQPTRGVDIGASEYIHSVLLEQRAAGTAILLVSEDLDEIRLLADRIAVIYAGRVVGIVSGDDVDIEEIGHMMAGSAERRV